MHINLAIIYVPFVTKQPQKVINQFYGQNNSLLQEHPQNFKK